MSHKSNKTNTISSFAIIWCETTADNTVYLLCSFCVNTCCDWTIFVTAYVFQHFCKFRQVEGKIVPVWLNYLVKRIIFATVVIDIHFHSKEYNHLLRLCLCYVLCYVVIFKDVSTDISRSFLEKMSSILLLHFCLIFSSLISESL